MHNPKRILQVLYSGLGGHASVAFTLANGFKKYGYMNYFVFYGVEDLNNAYKEQLDELNYGDNYRSIKKNTKTGLKEWIYFYKYLKDVKPDIVILHSLQLILPVFLFRLLHKTKIIAVEHDAISNRTPSKWLITNINSILADKVVVLTDFYLKEVVKKLWFKSLRKKYVIIPNGISLKKFKPKNNYFANSIPVVFMASRMNKLRDHKTLIEAVKKVNEVQPVQVRIAGDGETFISLKNKYGHLPFVKFLGNIDEKNIITELQKADIYVHATFAETFSTAILQAMSCGLPVITSDIDGTRHMIDENQNGLFYKNQGVKQLYDKLLLLLDDAEKAIQLGQNAREKVEQLYSDNSVIDRYLQLIEHE